MPFRVGVLIALVSLPLALRSTEVRNDRPAAAVPASKQMHRPLGMASCAASGCHGAAECKSLSEAPAEGCWRSSYTHWRAVDPHTRAFAALEKPLARQIVANLDRAEPGKKPGDPLTDVRCLACHTNPSLATAGAFALSAQHLHQLRAEGVSCEACHGNAGDWQYRHTAWRSPADRNGEHHGVGFAPLFKLGDRAMACMGCHVGAAADPDRGYPVRDMNHDMIAAGHPRLNFDFADYQRRLTPHWLETDETGRDVQDAVGKSSRAWLVGKLAEQEVAARLLADRADRATKDSNTPWPEFAESNCFACHHDLVPESWRAQVPTSKPGALTWQTHWPWPFTLPNGGDDDLKAGQRVKTLLQSPRPDRAKTAQAAREWADVLARKRAEAVAMPSDEVMKLVRRILLEPKDAFKTMTWDEAAQAYLALAAFQRDRTRWVTHEGQPLDPQPDILLGKLREALILRRTPKHPLAYSSPIDYTPDAVRGLFRHLSEVIPPDERYQLPDDP